MAETVAPHNDPARMLAVLLFTANHWEAYEARIRALKAKVWYRSMSGPECETCWRSTHSGVLCSECQFVRDKIWAHLSDDGCRSFLEFLCAKDAPLELEPHLPRAPLWNERT